MLLAALWLLRVPSLAQPMASDQGLYAYAGQRLMAGDAPYAGAWDQKPPGIHVIYGVLWAVWPHQSVVAAADMAAAGAVAWLLVIIGRRRLDEATGVAAAAVYLFFGNPALTQRLGGVFVRGQCETFIALAITGALALAATHDRRRGHLLGIGVLLGAAFWLKYNAAAYAVTAAVALACWPRGMTFEPRAWVRELATVSAAGLVMVLAPIALLALTGSVSDLYLATIAYNARYSGDTYDGLLGVLRYAAQFPVERARNDALWFLGGLGVLASLATVWTADRPTRRSAAVAAAWLAGAWLSILINGARHLPQYFVQAWPALALAAGVGLVLLGRRLGQRHRILPWVAGALVLVGAERATSYDDLLSRTRLDWQALTGPVDRARYLADFGGRPQDKFVAGAIDELVRLVRATTAPTDTIYVFGFSPGVPVLAGRRSASRFHWSQPIVSDFEVDRPGYGPAGLLAELQRHAPAIVALQRDSWAGPDRHSADYFHGTPLLETWLTAHYTREADLDRFEVWRRKP